MWSKAEIVITCILVPFMVLGTLAAVVNRQDIIEWTLSTLSKITELDMNKDIDCTEGNEFSYMRMDENGDFQDAPRFTVEECQNDRNKKQTVYLRTNDKSKADKQVYIDKCSLQSVLIEDCQTGRR